MPALAPFLLIFASDNGILTVNFINHYRVIINSWEKFENRTIGGFPLSGCELLLTLNLPYQSRERDVSVFVVNPSNSRCDRSK